MRRVLVAGLLACAAVAYGQHYQYRVLIGDRDAERGVLYYDYPSGNFGALGICDPSPTANDFYYGIAIHHTRGELWVCNVLRNRIDILDFEGNCLRTMPSGFRGPHGIASHPNGDKVVFSHNTFAMAEYTISTGQWRPIMFYYYDEIEEVNVIYLDGIYGIEWSPNGDYLYAAAKGGVAEIVADPDGSLTNTVRCQVGFHPFSTPWDVGIVATGADTRLVATDDDFVAPREPRVRRVGLYRFTQQSGGCERSATFANHPDTGGLLFGIEHAPDGTIWMTNYDRGLLYQLAADGALLRRVQVGSQKVGVGLAILPWCWSHNGDVNNDGCIDDADLLSVLFQFGRMERGIREDTNCDGIVDDADLLTVLFHFGSGC
jgi:DNA-binding beta-propeller fold protein YncE